jgi:hypothetical protein
VKQAMQSQDGYLVNNLLQTYLTDLPKSVKVVNKLDQVYRN